MSSNQDKPFFIGDGNSVCLDIPLKDRIKILLTRLGRSQNWLADQVEVSVGTMSKIVNAAWIPTSNVMTRIGQVLECDSVILFGDTQYWKNFRDKMLYLEKPACIKCGCYKNQHEPGFSHHPKACKKFTLKDQEEEK